MNKPFSFSANRSLMSGGISALLLGVFLKLTSEFREGEVTPLDQAILAFLSHHRQDHLTAAVKILTALGSPIVLGSCAGIAFAFLCLKRRWRDARYFAIAGLGARLLTEGLKHYISRPRPDAAGRLVEAGGFSYPSGHALGVTTLYAFLTFVIGRHIQNRRRRMLLNLIAAGLIISISASRLYLGVHYPSDVLSGFFLGLAWALLLAAVYLR